MIEFVTMQFPSLLYFAGLVAVAQSQDTGAETFGGLEPVIPIGQWIPVTDSYSKGPYDAAIYLSFDGMHQFDLTRYIATHPDGNFAKIINNAVVYSNARANAPSDSLPATAALFSGASSRNTGIY